MRFKSLSIVIMTLMLLAVYGVVMSPDQVFSQPMDTDTEQGNRMDTKTRGFMGLTDEQRQKLQAVKNKFNPLIDDVELAIQRKRLDLAAELRKNDPNRGKIDEHLDGLAALQKKRHKIILDEYFAVRSILTPEQNRFYVRRLIRSIINDKAPGGKMK